MDWITDYYQGSRDENQRVTVTAERHVRVGHEITGQAFDLNLRLDLRGISTNFDWGYEGNMPRQLALAILADYFGGECALLGYERFMRDVIAKLPVKNDWRISVAELRQWLRGLIDAPSELERVIAKGS